MTWTASCMRRCGPALGVPTENYPYPVGLVPVPVACVLRRTQSPLHRAARRHGGDALLQDLQDRFDVQRRWRCRIKDHLHVTGNAWPGVAKEQHQCLALPVVAANIDPHHRLRGILGGLLLLFGLLSRCLSGSSHVDQREADHQQRQDGHGSTEGHPIFRPDVSDDVSDDLHASNSPQSKRGFATRSGE
jgi:hypothetical protein